MPTALPVNWLFATLLLQHRFGDNSLNDGRGLPWIGFSLPGRLIANTFAQALNIGLGSA